MPREGRAQPTQDTKTPKQQSFLVELLKFGFVALVIVLPIRLYVAQPFIVSGASMEPTFENGEYLIIDELSYRFNTPARGDVVIFRYPKDTSKFFIKRIVGLPGEKLIVESGIITLINSSYPQGTVLDEPYLERTSRDSFSVTLEQNEYFVLGDNRTGSSDSRVWGPVEENLIVGRALLRLLPVARAAVLPGEPTEIEN